MTKDSVAVVGGGHGGLGCSIYLAKAGYRVRLFEKASVLGGRARTKSIDGYLFNMGAHASYNSGAGADVMRELGIERHGGSPGLSVIAYRDGGLYPISAGLKSILSNHLLPLREKVKALRVLRRLNKIDTEQFQSVTWTEWLEELDGSSLSALVETLFRLVTYANDAGIASVGPALEYLRKAYDGVMYLDGGWQTIVDSILQKATGHGVEIRTGTEVEAIDPGPSVHSLLLSDGSSVDVSSVVLATDPRTAAKISRDRELAQWAESALPVRSATLEVALSRLPNPNITYCLGVDKPLYFSVHSNWARLAPNGGSAVEMHKYLGTGIPSKPEEDRAELEAFLEVLQPGWRSYATATRFLPELVANNALVEASKHGVHGRHPARSSTVENLYFVGDWVGTEGMLSDTSLASARLVSKMIARNAAYDRTTAN